MRVSARARERSGRLVCFADGKSSPSSRRRDALGHGHPPRSPTLFGALRSSPEVFGAVRRPPEPPGALLCR
eukprot:7163930-Alexandrium_andersonii.AAC.1